MKRIELILLVLFTLVLSTSAQTYKLDEFRQVDDAELKSRVDWIFTHLNHSEEKTAYVIVYAPVDQRGADGERTELLLRLRRFVGVSEFHEKRTTIVFGGYRKSETAEVFIVPKGGVVPEPSWTIADSGGSKEPLLWSTQRFREEDDELDEFVNRALLRRLAEEEESSNTDSSESDLNEYNGPAYDVPNDSVPIIPESEPDVVTETYSEPEIKSPSIEVVNQTPEIYNPYEMTAEELEALRFKWIEKDFAEAVAKRDGASGVMIFYADDQFYDISRLHAFIEQGRDRITGLAGLDVCQIEVLFGGYRGQAQIEYYIVPEGGKAPEAKPEER